MSNDKLIPKLRFAEFQNEAGWQEKTLAEFSDLESGDGNWILSKDITSNGEFKIVQLSSIGFGLFKEKTLKTISNETFLELNGTPIQKGDLLLNRMVDSNKINCCIFPYDGKYVTSVDVCWIRNNPFFNNYFLLSLICEGSSQNKLLSLSSGAGRVRISKKNLFEKFSFLLPKNPQEQQKIAICLSSLDEVIAANSQKLDLLKDHKKSLMQNLFPHEGEKVPKYRFKDFEKDGEWVEKVLSEVALYENGKAHEQDISENGNFIVVNSKFISTDGAVAKHSNSAYCLAEKGDVLMVLSDIPNGRAIAKCFYVIEENKYTVNQRICKIKSIDCDSLFLYYVMNRNAYFLAFDDGVKQTNLKNDDVQSFPFLAPNDPKEQQKIASCLSSLDALITAQAEKIEQLKLHKKGLMQGLFPRIND
jgi:type I restriction enzyme S subunit